MEWEKAEKLNYEEVLFLEKRHGVKRQKVPFVLSELTTIQDATANLFEVHYQLIS